MSPWGEMLKLQLRNRSDSRNFYLACQIDQLRHEVDCTLHAGRGIYIDLETLHMSIVNVVKSSSLCSRR
jgi:hypothetical protein